MYKNLSKYIETLAKSDLLIRIGVDVSPELEISEIVDRVSKSADGGRALLFERTGTDFPVLCNMMGSERRMALALGVSDLDELPRRVAELLDALRMPRPSLMGKLRLLPVLGSVGRCFVRHSGRRGECQRVVWRGDEIDLAKLPILGTWPADAGRFVTLPMVHTIDPVTKERNVGMYRMQVLGRDTTALHWHIHKTGAHHYERWKSLRPDSKMPVAVCLGGDPAYTYAATAPLPEGIDEYLLAGFLRRKAVRLVRCLTSELEVPSDCDIVIEGYVDTAEPSVVEGPFGDHTGFYSLADRYPVFHVTCITHRRGAVYPATVVGIPPMEDRYIALATQKLFEEPIRAMIAPEVVRLTMPWQGVAHNLAVVQIDKRYAGQGLKVASALWGAGQMSFCKIIVVVDSADVAFDWATINAHITITQGVADVLDHAGEQMGLSGKMCVDMTSTRAKRWRLEPIFDSGVDTLSADEKAWIALANVDPARDVELTPDSRIVIDARSKTLKNRAFPNIVTMDARTVDKVDRRWAQYGLGTFIESPSRRYYHLLKGNGAEQTF